MRKQWQAGDRIECDMAFSALTAGSEGVPDGYIAGIASTPSTDLYGHKVLAKAFDDSIRAKGLSGPRGIKLLASHEWHKPAGIIKRLDTVGDNLHIEAQLNLNVSYVKDLHEVAKQNNGLSFSVGFALQEFEFVDEDKIETKNDPWVIIKKGDLMEVSVVCFPACVDAEMTFIKTLDTFAEFERALMADGLCKSRNEAHRLALWAKTNAHLLQPKPPVLVDKVTPPAHPLMDASMLRPMADLLAKARATLSSSS